MSLVVHEAASLRCVGAGGPVQVLYHLTPGGPTCAAWFAVHRHIDMHRLMGCHGCVNRGGAQLPCWAAMQLVLDTGWRSSNCSPVSRAVMSVTVLIMSLLVERLWVVLPKSPYFASLDSLVLTFFIMLFGGFIAFFMVTLLLCDHATGDKMA